MAIPELQDFYLAGGTCLSLRYGHRKSIDLDLFSITDFDIDSMVQVLQKNFSGFEYRNIANTIGVFGFIDDVKVDLVKYHFFKQIDSPQIEEGIRMYSDRDIIAMKVFAILKRAQKKDFWDVAELLKHYPIKDFIDGYNEKYPNHQLLISIPQALIYFEDASKSDDPVSLKGQTWASQRIFAIVKSPNFY
jgi:predicted nucleotidyltransferase component of viral defense system